MDDWCVTRNASWAPVRSHMLKTGCTFSEVPVFVNRLSDFAIQETLNRLHLRPYTAPDGAANQMQATGGLL